MKVKSRALVRVVFTLVLVSVLPVVLAALMSVWTPAVARAAEASEAVGTESLRFLPVQDAGRVKPFDTFAREALQLVYGSQEFRSPQGGNRSAIEIVLTWMLLPQYWDSQKIVQINHRGLKESLKLDVNEKYFSPAELFANQRLGLVFGELGEFRQTKQKLDPYYQAVQRLENQLGTYQTIRRGDALRVVPPREASAAKVNGALGVEGGENLKWRTVGELDGDLKGKFATMLRSFIQALPNTTGELQAMKGSDAPALPQAVEDFKVAARAENPSLYANERAIAVEVHDHTLHPFMIAWMIYLLAAILMGVAWQTGNASIYKIGWVAAALAFAMHTYGFGIRMYLTGRPPVSNMYESVVWVSWGAVVFSMIFETLYRKRVMLLAGSIVGVLCLVVANLAPTVLDPSIQPLEPVLRSNMWLSIHVLTITLSYSAFFLAWCLGNIGLAFVLRGERVTTDRVRMVVQSIYRALQVGVVLLAAGTILGGIWADYSWGRFWGWDPKETWALIALLGYLALLHGRLVGMFQNFGMMVGAIIAFNLVLMAWYGVNFVLGAGLHSYGFGAGGVQYVAAFVILDMIYVGYVAFVRANQMKASAAPAPEA